MDSDGADGMDPRLRSLERSEDRLLAIYEMIRSLNSETDPDRLLESMLDMALRVVGAERGMILVREGGEAEFSVHLARNLERETIRDAAEFSRGVVSRAGEGTSVLAMDTESDDRLRSLRSVSLFGIRSVMCVPLRSLGTIAGAVYVDSRNARVPFGEDDLRFLEAFADHAALALENARRHSDLQLRNRQLRAVSGDRDRFDELVGSSAAMQGVYDRIERFAKAPLPVLILGESGTGKELVARAIHRRSPRAGRPLLSQNCAAIAETLLESELFGHVKGAFTGADRDRPGLFEQADRGTLFLDEVGDMPPPMQARLLRVLQEGELRRVGGDRPFQVDVRVLAATHRNLEELVAAGSFREDLFYRLQVLALELPPLRERPGDVELLVEHLMERIGAARARPAPPVGREVLDLLERFHWPGNVRQLENTLQRLALLAGEEPIEIDTLAADDGLRSMLLDTPAARSAPLSLDRNERERIREALAAAGGNKARAARMLGISRATIFRKIKQLDLD